MKEKLSFGQFNIDNIPIMMCGNPNSRFLVRLIVDIIILLAIYLIALIGLPYWLRKQQFLETEFFNITSTETGASFFRLSRRGFFCDDESLNYPYMPETILNKVHMTIVTIALPAAVILAIEMLCMGFSKTVPKKFNFVGLEIPTLLSECYQLIGVYLFGLGLLLVTINLIKNWTGRLRPYFFDVCQPQLWDGTTCDDEENYGRYIEEYSCSELATVSAELLATLRQSFPSGYATCTCYALAFLAFYLQARLRASWLRLLRLLLQFMAAAVIFLVAIERVNAMRHHWSDAFAGIILGLIFAAFVAIVVLELFGNVTICEKIINTQNPNTTAKRRKYPKYF